MSTPSTLCLYKLEAVPNIFTSLHPNVYTTTLPSLGLIDRLYGVESVDGQQVPWDRLQTYVEYLNSQSPDKTVYKVLYIVRHGYGYHNDVMARVGSDAWKVCCASKYNTVDS
jgi:hypothetical protein